MSVEIYPNKKNCIFCNKRVTGFNSYHGLTYSYKINKTDVKDGIVYKIYEKPYHFKCAEKNYLKD